MNSALHDAAMVGDIHEVESLLASGVDVNSTNRSGQTALFIASVEGHTEIVRVLLAAGADVDIKDNEDRTPLFISSALGLTDIAQALINAGADPNGGNGGKNPLIIATFYLHTEVIRVLLEAGADPTIGGNNGISSIVWAMFRGDDTIVNLMKNAIEEKYKRKEARRTGRNLVGLREVVNSYNGMNDPGSIIGSFLTGNTGSLTQQINRQKQKSGISLVPRPREYNRKRGGKRKTTKKKRSKNSASRKSKH